MIGPAFLTDSIGFRIMTAFLVLQKLFQKKMAGETNCYNSLAFISLRMKLQWRSSPVEKIPMFQHFTQSD